MKYIKAIGAFLVGVIAFLLLQRYFSVPPFPSISVWLVFLLFVDEYKDGLCFLRILGSVLLSAAGAFLFGMSAYITFINYPVYGNYLAIACDVLNAIAFIGAGVTILYGIKVSER